MRESKALKCWVGSGALPCNTVLCFRVSLKTKVLLTLVQSNLSFCCNSSVATPPVAPSAPPYCRYIVGGELSGLGGSGISVAGGCMVDIPEKFVSFSMSFGTAGVEWRDEASVGFTDGVWFVGSAGAGF